MEKKKFLPQIVDQRAKTSQHKQITILFQIGCFVIAGYMVNHQFQLYVNNEDSSSVSYRKFNAEPQDTYPTYTVCISSVYGDIFKGDDFLGISSISPLPSSVVYNLILLGKCCNSEALLEKGRQLQQEEL